MPPGDYSFAPMMINGDKPVKCRVKDRSVYDDTWKVRKVAGQSLMVNVCSPDNSNHQLHTEIDGNTRPGQGLINLGDRKSVEARRMLRMSQRLDGSYMWVQNQSHRHPRDSWNPFKMGLQFPSF